MTEDLWRGSTGPRDAEIAIVGESWGIEEERAGKPFVGMSGQFLTHMLADAGIVRDRCFITNCIPRHPQDNKVERFFYTTKEAKERKIPLWRGLYPYQDTIADVERMLAQLDAVSPKVVIAFGNWSMYFLTGCGKIKNESVIVRRGNLRIPLGSYKVPTGIMQWRGSSIQAKFLVVPTIHPAAIVRQSHLRAIVVNDLRNRAEPISRGIVQLPHFDFVVRPTFNQALNWIGSRLGKKEWSVDIETRAGHIACVGLSTSDREAICLPFMSVEKPAGYWTQEEELRIRALIIHILQTKEVIGQNFHFDMQYFNRYLFTNSRPKHDTMIAQRVLWPGTPLSLYYQASMYCRHYVYWKDEGKMWEEGVEEEQLWRYNCVDCVRTFEIAQVQKDLLRKFGFESQFEEQMEIAQMGFEMMCRGIAVDEHTRAQMTFDVMDDMFQIETKLSAIIPPHILPRLMGKGTNPSPWYTSPSQQARLFYEILGLPPVFDPDTKAVTCDDAALEKIRTNEPILGQVCDLLQEERTLGIFLKNFLTKRLDYDRRMRCFFKPIPNTFRWSSSENAFGSGTNLQNIPKGDTD